MKFKLNNICWLGRISHFNLTPASNISIEIERTFGYDKLGRLVTAQFAGSDSDDSPTLSDFSTSYTYDPINLIDPTGSQVRALDEESQYTILMTLPYPDREFIAFDESGNIDGIFISEHYSSSENYKSLLTMVESPIVLNVSAQDFYTYMDNDNNRYTYYMGNIEYDEEFVDLSPVVPTGPTTGEIGFYGKTLLPGKGESNQNSSTDEIYIVINKGLSDMGAAQTFGHEGYGHAYMYMTTGNRKASAHDFIYGCRDKNKPLINRIVNAVLETINNNRK